MVVKMKRETFEAYKAMGKAISVQGECLIEMESGDMVPVKITDQVNYKGSKPNSFSPINVLGVNK